MTTRVLMALIPLLLVGARAPRSFPAPAGVSDLRAAMAGDSAVTLTWTEVSSSITVPAKYDIRYGRLGGYQWGGTPDVKTGGCAVPIYGSTAAGGRTRACVLQGLSPNTAYQVQLVAYTGTLSVDAVFGPLSNTATVVTAQRVGPLVVSRPRMFLDSVTFQSASLSDFGAMRFPLNGTVPVGDHYVTAYDSTGAISARGYLLVTKP